MPSSPLNYDVVSNIITFVTNDLSYSSLLALALVSRAFLDPALDVLWERQCSLGPLIIYTLPNDLWELGPQDAQDIRFKRHPVPSDWDRLAFYAYRIKTLDHSIRRPKLPDYYLHKSALHTLLNTYPAPFLPNLLALHSAVITHTSPIDHFLTSFHSLLTSKIKRLTLELPQNGIVEDTNSYLKLIISQCPDLEYLSINCTVPVVLTLHQSHLHRLRHFHVHGLLSLSADAVSYLSALPDLRELTLGLKGQEYLIYAPQYTVSAFPSLRRIALHSNLITLCTPIISSISSTLLEQITLDVYHTLPPPTLHDFLGTLSSNHAWHPTLHTLSIRLHGPHDSLGTFSKSTFFPLCKFSNLKCLALQEIGTIDLDDGTVVDMGTAWPLLETLSLVNASSPAESQSRITLKGMISLVNHCPKLHALHLGHDIIMASPRAKDDLL
ncbi:hypothetical protein SERLA73DRAFT_74372 [Serpula lacrymans var. lacrymans S7.3]|uniref:F-box domain-containing protein n=2 Tax=Serpula lacrymans var. lacrymans TaxID=341189 RepID=F8Q1G3_SERL3|nr:uncharacterized protein SERLADRAFT_439023 [Serpula lacrymans var. lacrymans S7.9]EGN98141.1 hypothetical protein SERLA73DRAFT_74372 [Serpula lacrymans var. lacrymans S7.3]EGO23717.1 hypothetical protein SERLADRAFT_439023 [Serpula lacrymans var. lacrymans S7.9]